jgi:hypothetical protein
LVTSNVPAGALGDDFVGLKVVEVVDDFTVVHFGRRWGTEALMAGDSPN